MGFFDSICAESGLIIDGNQQLIPIVETTGSWVPLGLPIPGSNDRYGTMDVPSRLDDSMQRLRALGRTFVYGDPDVKAAKVGLEDVLSEIRGDGWGATWNGKNVSFSLIDAPVFAAIVKAVKANAATAWTRYAKVALHEPEPLLPNREKETSRRPRIDAITKRLARAVLDAPADEGPRKVLLDHLLERDDPHARIIAILPAIAKVDVASLAAIALPETHAMYGDADKRTLKTALIELVRFLAWRTQLGPAVGEGQFLGYEATKKKYADLECYSKPYSDRARKKYPGMPELVAAIERNEKAFRERGISTDDDDDDDDD